MESTITKTIRGKYMTAVFNNSDRINIRHFKARNCREADYDENKLYTYDITIRHGEDEDPKELLHSALLDMVR